MRVVLDTDVLVAALRSDLGASRVLLVAALDQAYELLLSVPLVIEYEAVITRPEHLKAAGLKKTEAVAILDGLVSVSEQVRLSFRWRPVLSDPADDMVLETAVNGGADLLVTFNHRHFRSAARQFELQISGPGAALDRLRR